MFVIWFLVWFILSLYLFLRIKWIHDEIEKTWKIKNKWLLEYLMKNIINESPSK